MYAGALGAGAHAMWQVHSVRLNDKASCLHAFKSNATLGWIPFLAFAADRLLAAT
jgi:4-hydroxybenzoate polyprenyltransferase